jgi:hypothetical protein
MKRKTETLVIRRKAFFTIANDSREYLQSILPTEELVEELHGRRVDIFTFLERKWCCPIMEPSKTWTSIEDNIALLRLKNYDEWWKSIGKKTRNMIRKAEKSGLKTAIAEPDDNLAKGMWKIYNETPIRQERGFSHYGSSLTAVRQSLFTPQNCTYVAAFFQEELAGFVQLVQGESIMMISQILSMQKHLDKAVNNALVARAVEFCGYKGVEWLMYGRVGNHPSLDNFKQNNGFTQFRLARYYVPLSKRGRIAIQLGLHKELKDTLPRAVKYPLFPIYNWVSRTRMKLGLKLRPKQIT